MTERQQAIEDAAFHKYRTHGITDGISEVEVVELLTETDHIDLVDEYDWPRFREAIRRKYSEICDKVERGREARKRGVTLP